MSYARVAVPAPLKPLNTLLDYRVPPELQGQIEPGSLVEVPFARRKTWGLVFELRDRPEVDEKIVKDIAKLKIPRPVASSARLELFRWLSKRYLYPLGEACECAFPGPVRDGTDRTLKMPALVDPGTPAIDDRPPLSLNPAQAEALRAIESLSSEALLLWGITGSGKTEVYLRAIENCLRAGKGALVLVPEISLTSQLTQRFESRFPGKVAIFHSALKPTALRRAWLETLVGNRRIAVGARSALFAPVVDPGLIILDEEHDGSYKQEDRLRYHAREAALEYGRLCSIPVILGSATPSAESLEAVREGRIKVARLPERAVGEAKLPEIRVFDLKTQIAEQNLDPRPKAEKVFEAPRIEGDFFLTPPLREALEETLRSSRQALLFLNRRGQGSQLLCRGCGHTMSCPSCDVNLTPHGRGLLCHYCAFETPVPETCPGCGLTEGPFVRVGVGTEAIEEALHFHYPGIKTLRLDRDTAETNEQLQDILRLFTEKRADVLIGTQMIAKGHDFPEVTFVGIVLADIGLGVPDFRSHERSLQLLLQVSGRAGRSVHPGKVLLQTFQPEHPVFQALIENRSLEDYGAFMAREIETREALGYPPCGQLALLRFDGLDLPGVREAARKVAMGLRRIKVDGLNVLGPAPCPLPKIRNRHRWQILLKARSAEHMQKSLEWIQSGWDQQKLERALKTRMLVDVDPLSMM